MVHVFCVNENARVTQRRASVYTFHIRFAVLGLLVLTAVLSADGAVSTHLLPAPREVYWAGETALSARIAVRVPGQDSDDEFAARELEKAAKENVPAGTNVGKPLYLVTLLRRGSVEGRALLARHKLTFDASMEAEGYVLIVEQRQAWIIAGSASGVFYGVQTFKQLLPVPGVKWVLPTGVIRDWPAMKYRGIDDDLSRGPFPTLDFQKHQIRIFASFKVNVYSPYFEHTLLYPSHPLAAPPESSLTPSEAAELVDYARKFHVTIIPQQEAFGHLHQVLKNELYSDVEETRHGHVLAPNQPGSLPLIGEWFTQIAQEFPSPILHIGADETFDLGAGLTRSQVQSQGYGAVYVAFVNQIHQELAPLHRRLMFWGDIGAADPAAVAGLPKDMIAVPWEYSEKSSFDSLIEPFAKAGMETWVAPGDANWNEVYPIAKTAFANIQGFIRDGQRLGSTGALTTVWNDDGEGLFNMDWYSTLFGAAAAWQPGESSIEAYQEAYGAVLHGDVSDKINEAQKELMGAHAALRKALTGMTSDELFWIDPWSAEGSGVSGKIVPVAAQLRMHAEKAIVLLAGARSANPHLREIDALKAMDMGARRIDLIGLKFQLAQEIVDGYAQVLARQHDKAYRGETENMLDEISSMFGRCQDLRDGFSAAKYEYKQVWLSENRPYWLDNVLVRFDLRIGEWQRRGERFAALSRDFQIGKELPPVSMLGLGVAPEVEGKR